MQAGENEHQAGEEGPQLARKGLCRLARKGLVQAGEEGPRAGWRGRASCRLARKGIWLAKMSLRLAKIDQTSIACAHKVMSVFTELASRGCIR